VLQWPKFQFVSIFLTTGKSMSELSNEPTAQDSDHNKPKPAPELNRTSIFDAIASAVRKGAEHARKEAEEAMPRLKTAAADAAYWTAYGVVFAGVFQWTLVKTFTPDVVKKGCRDGVKAGRDAAERWVEQMTHHNEPLIVHSASPSCGDTP
jgi:hypothetical protein